MAGSVKKNPKGLGSDGNCQKSEFQKIPSLDLFEMWGFLFPPKLKGKIYCIDFDDI